MGKVKAKRSRHRATPTGVPTIQEAQQEVETAAMAAQNGAQAEGEEPHPLVQQIESEDSNQREFACGALANIVADESVAQSVLPLLLRLDVVRKACKCLSDSERGVCAEAAGLLGNLGLAGGPEMCGALLNAGVFPAAAALLRKSLEELTTTLANPETAPARREKEHAMSAVENSINLIWLLCENSDLALQHFSSLNLLPALVTCLDSQRFPPSAVLVAAQCLHTVSEDNPALVTAFVQQPAYVEGLVHVVQNPSPAGDAHALLLRVVFACILYNLRAQLPASVPVLTLCLGVCEAALQAAEPVAAVGEVLPVLASLRESGGGVFAKTEEQISAEVPIERVRTLLNAQQLALELITNMCAADDDAGSEQNDWEDQDDGDLNDAEVDMGEADMDADMGTGAAGPTIVTVGIATQLADVLLSSAIPNLVVVRCSHAAPHMYQILQSNSHGKSVRDAFVSVQLRALAALNNLLMALDEQQRMVNAVDVADVWRLLVDLAGQRPTGMDAWAPDFLEQTTSTLWSLLRRIAENQSLAAKMTLSTEDVEKLCSLAGSRNARVREYVAGILGVLAKHPGLRPALQGMCQTLCGLVQDPDLGVAAEALNSVYDSFAEDDVNDAVMAVGLMGVLEKVLPTMKAQFKQTRKTLEPSVRGRVDDALLNLPRFIKYKRPQFAGR